MFRNVCVLLLMLGMAIIIKSETKIEVDENGDEYEVKRFHIEGRAVNDGRSQCVITRRKRTTPTQPIEDEPRQQQVLFYYASEPIAEENHPNDKDIPFHSLKNQTNELALTAVLNNDDDNDETSSKERIKETGTGSQQFLQQLPQYSSINNGLIVVHSYEPQKYQQQQPQKVFALVPLPYGSLEEASEQFSSSGIWSIDDDDDGDDGDDDWEDISDDFVNSNNKRPNKTRNKKKSNKKSSSNKNKRKNNNKIKSRVSTTIKPTNHKKSNRRGVKVPNRRKEPTYQKNRRQQFANIDEYDDIASYGDISAQTDDDQEADVNCIIIRKEFTTTTTPRPFWNIFGRNANGTSRSSGQFGNRKRLNLRFVA